MASTTVFQLLMPVCMAIFAGAFMVLSRFNMPAALAWGLGLGFCGAAFAASLAPLPPVLAALSGDTLFAAGFYFYAEAFLIHFGKPLYRRERLAFAAIYLIMDSYVVLRLGNLHLELLLTDIATSCLLGFALVRVMHSAVTLAERAVVLVGSVVVIDMLIRVLIFVFFSASSNRIEDFAQSSYAIAMQATTSVIGVFYVLAIAGALADRVIRRLRDDAERDPLTGLLNRRGFEEALSDIGRTGKLNGAVIICDIDHFKQVNDRYGHAAGDRVIQTLAEALQHHMPINAITARFGGEEFVAFLPAATLAEAGIFAQTLRAHFAAQDWRHMTIERQITASFGVASVFDGEDSAHSAIKRADKALYDAKAAGRNKVIWHGGHYEPGGSIVDIQRLVGDEIRRISDGS
jgi:diguanylate cyclase (GGDEF)-like protein